MDRLIEAYNNTLYVVDEFEDIIRIGKLNDEADAFCVANGLTTWAFLTAWNPLSKPLTVQENQERNNALLSDLDGYKILTGRGKDPKGIWPAEESFFVGGISPNEACLLGRKYGQRAIVVGSIKSKAKLIALFDATGNEKTIRKS